MPLPKRNNNTRMYCDFIMDTPIQLSATPQLVANWVQTVDPYNVDYLSGVFTWGITGVVSLSLERVYINNDQNPTNGVDYATVDVRRNGVSLFTRTLPIGAANNAQEPSIASFTSEGLRNLTKDDTFEIYVSATDGDTVSADDLQLIYMRIVAVNVT